MRKKDFKIFNFVLMILLGSEGVLVSINFVFLVLSGASEFTFFFSFLLPLLCFTAIYLIYQKEWLGYLTSIVFVIMDIVIDFPDVIFFVILVSAAALSLLLWKNLRSYKVPKRERYYKKSY